MVQMVRSYPGYVYHLTILKIASIIKKKINGKTPIDHDVCTGNKYYGT
jgi:hypothetical protein